MFQKNKLTIHDMNIWHSYTKINKHTPSQQKQYKKKGLIRNNLLHGALFFLRGYFRVQKNLCNYLWNLKTLPWENIRMGIKNMRNLWVWECVSLRVSNSVLNFEIQPPFIEARMLKNKQWRVECELGRVFLWKSQKGCVLSSLEERWAKALSTLQKCRMVLLDVVRDFTIRSNTNELGLQLNAIKDLCPIILQLVVGWISKAHGLRSGIRARS